MEVCIPFTSNISSFSTERKQYPISWPNEKEEMKSGLDCLVGKFLNNKSLSLQLHVFEIEAHGENYTNEMYPTIKSE